MSSSPTNTPFDYLRRKNGGAYLPEVYINWCKAREYVLDKLKDTFFTPDDSGHLHVIVAGDSPLMLSVVRQLALSTHYTNYVEYDVSGTLVCKNRTIITIKSKNDHIVEELKKEEYLCNLLDYCKYSVYGEEHNVSSYIDVEFEIVKELPQTDVTNEIVVKEEEVDEFYKAQKSNGFHINTLTAVLASGMYKLGDVIGNLPAEDFHCARRYYQALDKFQYSQMDKDKDLPLIDEQCKDNPIKVKESLSNLFCADCFEQRYKVMDKCYEEALRKEEKDKGKKLKKWEREKLGEKLCEQYDEALSQSEHERWVVEKLIMGYRPLNDAERLTYENLFDDARKAYFKKLKNNASDPAHIDICSYRELRRVNPDDMKYDSFLMLAIPKILEKVYGRQRGGLINLSKTATPSCATSGEKCRRRRAMRWG